MTKEKRIGKTERKMLRYIKERGYVDIDSPRDWKKKLKLNYVPYNSINNLKEKRLVSIAIGKRWSLTSYGIKGSKNRNEDKIVQYLWKERGFGTYGSRSYHTYQSRDISEISRKTKIPSAETRKLLKNLEKMKFVETRKLKDGITYRYKS